MHGSPFTFVIVVFLLTPCFPLKAAPGAIVDPAVVYHVPGSDSPDGKKIMGKLTSITIDKVNFDKLDMAAVVDFLTKKSKELDPEHVGVKFNLRVPPQTDSSTRPFHREVTIVLENVPLNDVLGYVSQQTNLSYKIEKGVVVFMPFNPATDTRPVNPTPT